MMEEARVDMLRDSFYYMFSIISIIKVVSCIYTLVLQPFKP